MLKLIKADRTPKNVNAPPLIMSFLLFDILLKVQEHCCSESLDLQILGIYLTNLLFAHFDFTFNFDQVYAGELGDYLY